MKPGDRLCFYESGVGVVAAAEVTSAPERQPPSVVGAVKDLARYPWSFRVTKARFFFDQPVVIDAELRGRLDAFAGRSPDRSWSWLVQGTRLLTAHDYCLLTGG